MADTSAAFQHRALAAGVTAAIIREVIHAFYDRVRKDPLLGPIFEAALGGKWELHLEKISQFWLTATRLGGRYDGRDFMPAHRKLSAVGSEHMDRWLSLFRQTLMERCTPAAADALYEIAAWMGDSIRYDWQRSRC